MHPGRGAAAQRRAVVGQVDALLVHGVPGFVDRAEESVVEVVLVIARGDAHIAQRKLGGEGVVGLIQPAALEIVADGLGHFHAKGILLRLRGNAGAGRCHRPGAGW